MSEVATNKPGRKRCRTSIASRAREIGVNRSTLLRWMQDGMGPKAIQVGRRVFITDDAWDAWQQERAVALS